MPSFFWGAPPAKGVPPPGLPHNRNFFYFFQFIKIFIFLFFSCKKRKGSPLFFLLRFGFLA